MNTQTHAITNWIARLDAVSTAVDDVFAPLNAKQLNWKPNAGTWSIAEILEHLIKVNTSYDVIRDALRDGSYRPSWTARIPFLPRSLGKMIHRSVMPENTTRVKTLPLWQPVTGSVDTRVVQDFIRQQEDLNQWIQSSAEHLDRRTIVHSPANPLIVYPLHLAFDILVTHQERHLAQARGVLAMQG